MDHKLRPVVRLDAHRRSALIELHGCLTVPATSTLIRLLSRSRSLNHQPTLDLRPARHIERDSLTSLRLNTAATADVAPDAYEMSGFLDQVGPMKLLLPYSLPVCPVDKALAGLVGRTPLGDWA